MKKYTSHKVVEAGVIQAWNSSYVDGSFVMVGLDPAERITVPADFFARGKPKIGDYLVRYADGYLSWSPKKAFEEGYTEVTA